MMTTQTYDPAQYPWGPPPTLEGAVAEAERYQAEMRRELAELSTAIENGEATYCEYDERAADLRELAEDHLDRVLAAYRREHLRPAYEPREGEPF